MRNAFSFLAVNLALLVMSAGIAHAQTDAASVPAQPQPYTPQLTPGNPGNMPSAFNNVTGTPVSPPQPSPPPPQQGILPASPSGPAVTYKIPKPYPPTPADVPSSGDIKIAPDDAPSLTYHPPNIGQAQQKLSTVLNSWIGDDINNFIMAWGAPNGEYKMPNGNIIYTWQNTGGLPAPDGGEIMISCKISIFTDSRGLIFNWRWQGNAC